MLCDISCLKWMLSIIINSTNLTFFYSDSNRKSDVQMCERIKSAHLWWAWQPTTNLLLWGQRHRLLMLGIFLYINLILFHSFFKNCFMWYPYLYLMQKYIFCVETWLLLSQMSSKTMLIGFLANTLKCYSWNQPTMFCSGWLLMK